jgi:SAM-dependent methyltransferase
MAEEPGLVDHYGAQYGHFATEMYAEIRREAFGADIGQNSWLTLDELERFISLLDLEASSRLLDVACGSGGATLHIARETGCEVVGVDLHEDALANATRMAREAGLDSIARFVQADASKPLPFEDAWFDAILCVDAVNHLAGRPKVFADWARLLTAGGRLLFTDPITVTGVVDSEEIAIRSSVGYYLFVPPGEDERLLAEAGLNVVSVEDATGNVAAVAQRWRDARAKHGDAVRQAEGDETFDGQQRLFEIAARLARERRLSRLVYLAQKPN